MTWKVSKLLTANLFTRLQHHFHAIFLLIPEDVVAVGNFGKRQAVGDDVVQHHFAFFHVGKKLVNVFVGRCLPAADGEALVEELADREVVVVRRIHAQHADTAAAAHSAHAGFQHLR